MKNEIPLLILIISFGITNNDDLQMFRENYQNISDISIIVQKLLMIY